MPKIKRRANMRQSLNVLLGHGVEVATVLDVGILYGTPSLIKTFPDIPHHLFEPVTVHLDKIRKTYKKIEHTLHQVALSDMDGQAYLACHSVRRNGKITHSKVVSRPINEDEQPGLVSCDAITKARLDTIMQTHRDIEAPYLLKVDVDGQELKVLEGAAETLQSCSIVVIEAPLERTALPALMERTGYLLARGFRLMDIVDMAYYNGVLWQVDLVFVREEIVQEVAALRPFQSPGFTFDKRAWYTA